MKLLFALVLAVALTACDEPRPRELKRNPVPDPTTLPTLPPASAPQAAQARAGTVTWDAAEGAFVRGGERLQAGRLWTFDGSTDGFVLAGGEVAPAQPTGLAAVLRAADPILRTPSGLGLEGAQYGLVLVRLTRVAPGAAWDGSVYYSTAAHGEAAEFVAAPLEGGDPQVNETVVLVYDMHRLLRGGDDWATSVIDQVRIDLDDEPGGQFVIHQVALVEAPGAPSPELRPAD